RPLFLSLSAREWLELPVYVRALRRVPAVWRRAFDDLHFELNRQFLRRIASGVIAGLILQFSVQHVLARHNTCKRAHNYAYRELFAVNAQLLIRSKRKTGLLARRVVIFPITISVGALILSAVGIRNSELGLLELT